jgi:hypothetical protein
MFGIPAQGYHRYLGPSASMRVKVGGVVTVVSAWQGIDAHRSRARFTNAGHTIHAELSFNDAGEMVDFVSDDRYQASADGTTMRLLRWSTPIDGYRSFGAVRLLSRGLGRWRAPEGEYTCIELTIDDVQYNVQPL